MPGKKKRKQQRQLHLAMLLRDDIIILQEYLAFYKEAVIKIEEEIGRRNSEQMRAFFDKSRKGDTNE
jgi:hypothetical protein